MVRLLIASLALSLFGCSGTSGTLTEVQMRAPTVADDIAPGTILLDVDGGGPYWQYEIKPSEGTVNLVREDKFHDNYLRRPKGFQRPMGAIDDCVQPFKSEAASADGKLIARCIQVSRFANNLVLIHPQDATTAHLWKPKGRRIRGFAWAPNSRSVAVLNDSSYVGLHPLEMLEALSGHPVSHCTVYLDIINASTGNVSEYVVARDVTNGWERILSWSK